MSSKKNRKHIRLEPSKFKPYYPELQLNPETDVFRSIKEGSEYDRLATLSRKQDLRKRLLREGFEERALEGKTLSELKNLLDGLVEA